MSAYTKQSPETIQQMFSSIARNYDRANALLSFNMHKRWNRTLVDEVTKRECGHTLLDLCAGTGDIAFEYIKKCKAPSRVTLLDFCDPMLECAIQKQKHLDIDQHKVEYVQGDAQHIPFGEGFASCVTIAYGIRNVQDPKLCIQEALRVLKPGGTFGILELTKPDHFFLRLAHKLYLMCILPTLGRVVTSNPEAYQYLRRSIQNFIPPASLEEMLRSAGFEKTKRIPLLGGIATILIGKKPK